MSQIIRKFQLTKGSQGDLSELHVLERLLDHYVGTGINDRAVSDNPKFITDPENPNRAYLANGEHYVIIENNLENMALVGKATAFDYTFPLCFTS